MKGGAMLRFMVYQAKDGWRWRAKRGGRIVADGGEAYSRRSGAFRALWNFIHAVQDNKGRVLDGVTEKDGYTELGSTEFDLD